MFKWENSLFQWPRSIANCWRNQRVYPINIALNLHLIIIESTYIIISHAKIRWFERIPQRTSRKGWKPSRYFSDFVWPGHEAPAEEIGRVETWKSHEISLYFLHMNMNYYYCCYCYLSLLLYVIVIIIITVIMHNVYFICYCLLSLLLSLLLYIYIYR